MYPFSQIFKWLKKTTPNKKNHPQKTQLILSASPTTYALLQLVSEINLTPKIFMAFYSFHSPPVVSSSPTKFLCQAHHEARSKHPKHHSHIELSAAVYSSTVYWVKHLKSCSNRWEIPRKKKTRTGFLSFDKTTEFIPEHSWQLCW